MKKKYNVTILGGTNGFGKWLVEFILKEFSSYVNLEITGSNDDNIAAVRDADIVIYSVPISCTQKVIEETLPHIKSGAVVADVTSIKKLPSVALSARDDLIAIPTHPMFGPYISSLAGQVIVLTPTENMKVKREYIFLKEFLQSKKAKLREETPENHDKMMAVVQGLTHLNMFVIGETMKRLDFKITDSMDFISPIYKLMVSSVGRYLGQNPGLYADIQMYNDEVLAVHEAFLDTAHNFHNSVKDQNYDKFCRDIISAQLSFGEENCREGQMYTDKIIYMLGNQIDILKNNTGKTLSIKNIYSGELISGILEKYHAGEIFFTGGGIYKLDEYQILHTKT